MKFVWDEPKNQTNIAKHGLDFVDGEELFQDRLPFLVAPDMSGEHEEDRWKGIGIIRGRVVVAIFVQRGPTRFASFRCERPIERREVVMKKRSKTNWDKVDALRDDQIDYADSPALEADFFQKAVMWPGPKQQITLRLSPEVLVFFRRQGKGYQTAIGKVLEDFVERQKNPPRAHRAKPRRPTR